MYNVAPQPNKATDNTIYMVFVPAHAICRLLDISLKLALEILMCLIAAAKDWILHVKKNYDKTEIFFFRLECLFKMKQKKANKIAQLNENVYNHFIFLNYAKV